MSVTDVNETFIGIVKDIRNVKYPEITQKHSEVLAASTIALEARDAAKASETNAAIQSNIATAKANEALASKNAAKASEDNAKASEASASAAARAATAKADEAATAAATATAKANEIKNITVSAATVTPETPASAAYDPTTGNITIAVPQGAKGDKGDKGDSFTVDAVGALSKRALYDTQPRGFSFLAIDEAVPSIYFKISDASGDWSIGGPFGRGEKGDKGDKGDDGKGIDSIQKIGTSGNVDTYEITYTDATTQTFTVTNAVGITGIALHSSANNVDTYRISYNNGSYFDFEVKSVDTSTLNDQIAASPKYQELEASIGSIVSLAAYTVENDGAQIIIKKLGDGDVAAYDDVVFLPANASFAFTNGLLLANF